MLDNDISFRKLMIFNTFMRERSIGKTAERLDLSPVSVHRALHSLEDAAGFPLFTNKGRNLVPLESALELLDYSRSSINLFQSGLDSARSTSELERRFLRLGVLCSIVPEVLPNIIDKMKKRKPQLEIEIVTGANSQLVEAVQNHQIDAAVIGSPYLNASKLHIVPLFQDMLYAALPVRSDLAGRQEVDLASFGEENFISLNENFSVSMHCRELFRIAGISPKIIATVHDIFSMLHLVSSGIGFTLMPGRMRKVCEANRVTLIPLTKKYRLEQDISLIFKPSSEKNPHILSLAAECRTYSRKFLVADEFQSVNEETTCL